MELMENGNVRIKLPSADSFDEDISDVDDDVFVRSSKNGYRRVSNDRNVKKPLMAPRRKSRKGHLNGQMNGNGPVEIETANPKGCPVIIAFLYAVIGIGAFAGIAGLVLFLSRSHLITIIQKLGSWESGQKPPQFAHCDTIEVENLWNVTLPYSIFNESGAVFILDTDKDNLGDVVIGTATGIDNKPSSSFLCELNLNSSSISCMGKLSLLTGRNGSVLWTTYLEDNISKIWCNADFNLDGKIDCVVVGKKQFIWVVNVQNGKPLWQTTVRSVQSGCSYSPLDNPVIINDVNGDKVPDILIGLTVVGENCAGHIGLLSGQSGKLLQLLAAPNSQHLAFNPILRGSGDGSDLLLLITKTANKDTGSAYVVPLNDYVLGRKESLKALWNNTNRVVSVLMADINNDGMQDVVFGFTNNSVAAVCGSSWNLLWFSQLSGKFLSFQTAANLNKDELLDVSVRTAVNINGTNLSMIEVLDGGNGQPLLNFPPRRQHWATTGASLNLEGSGQDLVVDWANDFLDGKPFNRLSAFSSHGELPGLVIYEGRDIGTSLPQLSSLEQVLQLLREQEDLRVKYSHILRRSQMNFHQSVTAEPPPNLEESEPKLIGYPRQHGVRKHGRLNAANPLPFEDYTEPEQQFLPKHAAPPAPDYYETDEESDYPYAYKNQQPFKERRPSDEKRGWNYSLRRGKREIKNPLQTITFPPLFVKSDAEITGSIDLLFGIQWTYPNSDTLGNRIAACVNQRRAREDSGILDSILECSNQVVEGTASAQVLETVEQWLEPLTMQYGSFTLSRNRLRCRCHHEGVYSGKPCSRIQPYFLARPITILP